MRTMKSHAPSASKRGFTFACYHGPETPDSLLNADTVLPTHSCHGMYFGKGLSATSP